MDTISVADIATLVGIMAVLIKAFVDGKVADGTVVEKYEEAITKAVERGMRLSDRIKTLEDNESKLLSGLAERDTLIATLKKKIEEMEVSIDRLVHQVKSLGATPVVERKKQQAVITGSLEESDYKSTKE